MEENMELQVVDNGETDELMEYEDNSTLVSGLIGLGIGIAGTLLAKKGAKAVKKLWNKRKEKKVVEDEDVIDDDDSEDDELFPDEDEGKTEEK